MTEDPQGIYDFINKEVRKEWEADARVEGREPKEGLIARAHTILPEAFYSVGY